MEWPDVCVMLLTYARTAYAVETVRSFGRNCDYQGQVLFHIADDGSDAEHLSTVRMELANQERVTSSNAGRRGYGVNYNLGTQVVHEKARFILPLEDDWRLLRQLPLNELVEDLMTYGDGCIRLGYIGWTQGLWGKFISLNGRHYLELDPDSDEPHVFAGHPRLETAAWERKVGPWPEGLAPGATEFEVAHWPKARTGVLWPLWLVNTRGDLFAHIGTVRSEDV